MSAGTQHRETSSPPRAWPATGLSIRGKIFAAFLALSAITGGVGAFAYANLSHSGRLVAQTYDRPLMSISFARQVLANFSRLEAAYARSLLVRDPAEFEALRKLRTERAAELDDDLAVVAKRATSDRARRAVGRVRAAINDWTRAANAALVKRGALDWTALDRSSAIVNEEIDLLVNYAAGDGFIGRQEALAVVAKNTQLQIAATLAALALSLVVAVLLSRRIMGPVASASEAANRIAQGELEAAIPVTGRDELASLLDAMGKMRDNIRTMMAKEVALRRSAQIRLIDAIESSSEGVFVVDGEGKIVVANTEVERCFNAVRSYIARGQDFHRLIEAAIEKGVFAADTPAEREALSGRLQSRGGAALEEQLADGRWLRIARNQTGDGGMVAIFSDISLQKERESVLLDAKERAEAGNRTKSEFLASMSHELRTPLNAVIGFSELMESEALGALGQPKYKEFTGAILGSARRLLSIINDILEWSKLDAGHLPLDIAPVTLAEIFSACRAAHEATFEAAGVALTIEAPPALAISADRAKLMLALGSLLSNAAKFTPAGGRAVLSAREVARGRVEITVADTGIGMKSEDIPRALTPFGQIDSRLARKYEGTGLGLALANAIVERHGGILTIDTAPGAGTRVAVRLGIALEHRPACAPAA
jgi:signal transduction histidine kinase/HAMP domain-containing protein